MTATTLIVAGVYQELVSQVPSASLTASDIWVRLLAVFSLIAVNAFFVTAEFAVISVRRSRINQLAEAGDLQARTVQHLQQSIDRLLSTTQLGITLSCLALGWIGEKTMAVVVTEWLWQIPLPVFYQQAIAHSLAIPITFLLLAYLQIVLGELCPKSVALLYSEQLARVLGAPSQAIARLFHPFVWILNQSTRFLLRLVGIPYTVQGWYDQVTPEELQRIITTSSESTGLEAEKRELLSNVLEFGDVSAGEVMIPRTNIIAISSEATLKELLEEVAQSGHTRYPVIGESLDDVRGIIQFRDLAEPLAKGNFVLDDPIHDWVRPVRFVPEYLLLSELLPLMQRSRQSMVMVVDEYGGTAGLVTVHDLIAEILGEPVDSTDDEEAAVRILDEQTFLVQAQIDLEAVNELLNLDMPLTDDYLTLGGFLIYQLQKIPQPGDTLYYEGYEFRVVSMDGPRLHQIQIHRPDADTLEESNWELEEEAAADSSSELSPPLSPEEGD